MNYANAACKILTGQTSQFTTCNFTFFSLILSREIDKLETNNLPELALALM